MRDISDFEYLTYEWRRGKIVVHGWDMWPNSSVLAGQERKSFIDSFETEEDAQIAYPSAGASHEMMQPQNTFDHLPDDSDY